MPSSYKTPNIGLNKFIATDKPKMDDVNFDNQKLDDALHQHFSDNSKHFTQSQAITLHNSMMTYGFYTGNGSATQKINLGFYPRAGIIFAPAYVPFRSNPNSPDIAETSGAFFTREAQTKGVRATATGLTVMNNDSDDESIETTFLNFANTRYHYIIWK